MGSKKLKLAKVEVVKLKLLSKGKLKILKIMKVVNEKSPNSARSEL